MSVLKMTGAFWNLNLELPFIQNKNVRLLKETLENAAGGHHEVLLDHVLNKERNMISKKITLMNGAFLVKKHQAPTMAGMQNENVGPLKAALENAAGRHHEVLLDHVLNKKRNMISKKITLIDEAFLVKEMGFAARDAATVLFELKVHRCKITYKNVNDPVHGTIRLHPLAVAIIDTPPFQRLRHIHQVGMTSYVYPGGTHSRFEHSLGVYHLAGKMLEVIRNNQPELNITDVDALCVQIAALCHDIGHGPFSHMFDKGVIQEMDTSSTLEWRHETQSKHIINELILPKPGSNEIDLTASTQFYEEWGLTVEDKNFILALVEGPHEKYPTGRDELSFLYDIVRDGKTGLDVDRWDYYMRDCLHLGLKNSFLPGRLMHHLRVIEVPEHGANNGPTDQQEPHDEPGNEMHCVSNVKNPPEPQDGSPEQQQPKTKKQLCVRDKERAELYNMFNTRYELHRKAYKHPVVQAVDMMMSTALRTALTKTTIVGQKAVTDRQVTPENQDAHTSSLATDAPQMDTAHHSPVGAQVGSQPEESENSPESSSPGSSNSAIHQPQCHVLQNQESRKNEKTLNKIVDYENLESVRAFVKIDDRIVHQIMNADADQETDNEVKVAIKEAQALIRRIEERKLWKLVVILKPRDRKHKMKDEGGASAEKKKKKESGDGDDPQSSSTENNQNPQSDKEFMTVKDVQSLAKKLNEHLHEGVLLKKEEEIKLRIVKMHFGTRRKNPIERIRFFDKDGKLVTGRLGEVIKPSGFEIELIYAYCTDCAITKEDIDPLKEEILKFVKREAGFEEGQRP